ncbi:MAG TPA: hypothetical protein VIH16_01305 [Bellilinea sp.]
MAELNNGREGDLYLGVTFDLHHKVLPQGIVARNHVNMNSDLGLLWAAVCFWVGTRPIYTQDILLHADDIRRFSDQMLQVIETPARPFGWPKEYRTSTGLERELSLNFTSPELICRVRQSVYLAESNFRSFDVSPHDASESAVKQALAEVFNAEPDSDFVHAQYKSLTEVSTSYEVLVVIEAGIGRGSPTVRGEGPAMFLEPDQERLQCFIRDLRSEAEIGLLFG